MESLSLQLAISIDFNNYWGTLQQQPSISRAPQTPLAAGMPCSMPHDFTFAPSAQSETSQNNSNAGGGTPMNLWCNDTATSQLQSFNVPIGQLFGSQDFFNPYSTDSFNSLGPCFTFDATAPELHNNPHNSQELVGALTLCGSNP